MVAIHSGQDFILIHIFLAQKITFHTILPPQKSPYFGEFRILECLNLREPTVLIFM